jgi:hypothetical protein
MTTLTRFGLIAALVLLGCWTTASGAMGEDQSKHCPAATANNSVRLFAKGNDFDTDRRHLADVAASIASYSQPLCILALVNAKDVNHSKILALKNIEWVKKTLMADGVSPALIAAEARQTTDQDADLQTVTVIIGK